MALLLHSTDCRRFTYFLGNPWIPRKTLPRQLLNMPVQACHETLANNPLSSRGKRKVVEHIVLYKTKEGFSQQEEKDMLDFLYTSQYYTRGVLSLSLGRIVSDNLEGVTHAVYMRFPSKEVLEEYYRNSYQSRVLNEYVIPYCHDTIALDYEAYVEDDIIQLFRRGEDFEHGIEFFILISAHEGVSGDLIHNALSSFSMIIEDFRPMLIQFTYGTNINNQSHEYTHAMTIRFTSEEALETVRSSNSYALAWNQKILPISSKILTVYYVIDSVGKTIM